MKGSKLSVPVPVLVMVLPALFAFPVIAALVIDPVRGVAALNQIPPPLPAPLVPAVLPLITVPWSMVKPESFQIPPPSPAAWFPEIWPPWIVVGLAKLLPPIRKSPPASPIPVPWVWVARLFRTLVLVIISRAGQAIVMPPPLPAAFGSPLAGFLKVLLL